MQIGNSNISNLFICIDNNKIIVIKSALKDFVDEMKKIEANVKNRNYYSKHFNTNSLYFYQNPTTGKRYTFQKIENKKNK